MSHASASRPHHMLVVVYHTREELTLVRTAVLLRGRAEATGLFGNGQLAEVRDTKFDSWDRVKVVLIRRAHIVDVLPLGVAPTVRGELHERLIEATAADLWSKTEGAVERLGVRVASERSERTIFR